MLCYHMLAPELGHVAQMPMFERRPLPAMSLWRVVQQLKPKSLLVMR